MGSVREALRAVFQPAEVAREQQERRERSARESEERYRRSQEVKQREAQERFERDRAKAKMPPEWEGLSVWEVPSTPLQSPWQLVPTSRDGWIRTDISERDRAHAVELPPWQLPVLGPEEAVLRVELWLEPHDAPPERAIAVGYAGYRFGWMADEATVEAWQDLIRDAYAKGMRLSVEAHFVVQGYIERVRLQARPDAAYDIPAPNPTGSEPRAHRLEDTLAWMREQASEPDWSQADAVRFLTLFDALDHWRVTHAPSALSRAALAEVALVSMAGALAATPAPVSIAAPRTVAPVEAVPGAEAPQPVWAGLAGPAVRAPASDYDEPDDVGLVPEDDADDVSLLDAMLGSLPRDYGTVLDSGSPSDVGMLDLLDPIDPVLERYRTEHAREAADEATPW